MATSATFVVTGSGVWAYTNTTSSGENTGRIRKNGEFSATPYSGTWLLVTSDTTTNGSNYCSGVIKNRYVNMQDAYGSTMIELSEIKATTEATTDENGNTINTDASGNESTNTADSDSLPIYIDDAFIQEYSSYISADEYSAQLSQGLKIQDIRAILGCPHQFTPITDPRIDSTDIGEEDSLGRIYAEKIIKQIPLLLMTPGVPSFMSSFSDEQKETVVSKLIGAVTGGDLDELVNEQSGKYYTLKYAYKEYFYYVNAMLRSAAIFLEIDDETIDGRKLGSMNWLYNPMTEDGDIFGHAGLSRFLGPYAGAIAFYADVGNSTSDSFSNSTTTSQLASALNSLSDTGRELNFLVGNVGSVTGLTLNSLTGSEDLLNNMETVKDTVDSVLGRGNIMSNILNKAQTILAGGRMVFPEIWSDSSFGRSYSATMKLVSPSGDKLSVFLNILVPIYHLLAFCLPRQSIGQSYFSPFLVRAYYKSMFNVDMGIITSLNITKGAEGEWTIDGLPTVANIDFDIKDLYEGMFMSSAQDVGDINIMSNITELDYIANSCGININDQEVMRTIKLYKVLNFTTRFTDKVSVGIFGGISQYFNQKLANIFGVF